MTTILNLPSDVFLNICKHLDTVEDVLSLQCSHKLFNYYINKTFWGSPKCLLIGAENKSQIMINDNHKIVINNPTEDKILSIVSKMRNMKELYISKDDKRITSDIIENTLRHIQFNKSIKLEKIIAMYNKPESFIKNDKHSWPKKRVHDQLCELILSNKKSILSFALGIDNTDDFVSISRTSIKDHELEINYNHESTWESRQIVFFPLLNAFSSSCPTTKTLNIKLRTSPNMAHILVDHCVLCAASSHRSNRLEHINIRFTLRNQDNKENDEIIGFDHFQNVKNLKTLVWSFDSQLSEEIVEKFCCPKSHFRYDIYVDTPKLKKTFLGSHSKTKINTSPMLKCIS